MTQRFRLPRGGRIDRARPVLFTFDGRVVEGFAGDTAASALLANGIHLVGRSFKYHRPRGILAAGSEEPNALFDVDRGQGRQEPNARATGIEVFDGLRLTSQNRWPSLAFDIGAVADRAGGVLSAGFYYKTFKWPPAAWARVYEPLIRRMAGLGRTPPGTDPEHYAQRHAHCEVLVVGAGPAGLAAALAASEDAGVRVMLADEQNEPGGSLLHDLTSEIDGRPVADWLADACARLRSRPNVRVLARATAFAYTNHNHIGISERLTDHLSGAGAGPRERLWFVRAGRVVLATGAHERPLLFADNDRPGVMLAEAVRTYINRYGVAPGRRIVVATTGASAYRAALDAATAGLEIRIVDARAEPQCGPELAAARAAGIRVDLAHAVVATHGRHRVSAAVVAPLFGEGIRGDTRTLACDCIATSGGWTPAVHLFSQSRGRVAFDAAADAFLPVSSVQELTSVGACRGVYDLACCLDDGARAGGLDRRHTATATMLGNDPEARDRARRAVGKGKAFVDVQNDVTTKDIALAVREGFHSVEHVKRYTTTGMATDQGKTSNLNALAVTADALATDMASVGLTTFRPPYTPVTLGAFAGHARADLFDPVRTTPLHAPLRAAGAAFEDVGAWKRAHYIPRGDETMPAAVARECLTVRTAAGLFDASTLGKIDVTGPDAGRFLDRIYTNTMSALPVGRCRYGLMLKEDGTILDDGVAARIADHRYHLTTTTGGAERVLLKMEDFLQTEWPDLRVFLTSTTERWAVIAVQGPRARHILARVTTGTDLAAAAFPHMSWRDARVAGVNARIMRVSFTGELGYEVNVSAADAVDVWQVLLDAGRPYGAAPYGTEAMHVLRAEKGYIIIGQETDGTGVPDDVGLGGLVGRRKGDFVGGRSLSRPHHVAPDRKQLVGLQTDTPAEVLDEGAQIVETPSQAIPMRMLGHVTSAYASPTLGRSIALALVSSGRDRIGTTLYVTTRHGFTTARVVAPVFYDPEGARLHD